MQIIGHWALTLNLFVARICGFLLWGFGFLLWALALGGGHWMVRFATKDIAMALRSTSWVKRPTFKQMVLMTTPRGSLGSITCMSIPQLGISPSQCHYPLLHPSSISTNFNGLQIIVEAPPIGGSSSSVLRHSNTAVLPSMHELLPKKRKT